MKLPQLSKIQTISEKIGGEGKVRDPGRWRDLLAYWILGLCNNFGYVVMLSAAHGEFFIIQLTLYPGAVGSHILLYI